MTRSDMPASSALSSVPQSSKSSDMDRMYDKGWKPGPTETLLMSELAELADSTGTADSTGVYYSYNYETYEWYCMACGELPAESRDESVFVLCAGCCEKLRVSYSSDLADDDGNVVPTQVWHAMHRRYGYGMVDKVLDEMIGSYGLHEQL